jgi:putative transcriptional regulator
MTLFLHMKNTVEKFRKLRGETKAELAKIIGVCPSYITRLENWDIQPKGEVMFRLAQHFGCRIEDLFQPETSVAIGNILHRKLPYRSNTKLV